ncbi:uncharacterized protein BCR38DRAFT_426707 [Pseudomassariella vexata]|uniref:Uncharacterized protein n=1 Tax=Pseudomassariella vexata TaxID=1141098 RepID=A0A1Y2E718_9PEZI|nr:uncharacterized protein BCR38DRAFT_426707 [Pseudomassariella vexata]ORY67319.1 hypothetical protein BCR38DRAFT_426707 [Pseudomassariella vexata]
MPCDCRLRIHHIYVWLIRSINFGSWDTLYHSNFLVSFHLSYMVLQYTDVNSVCLR